MSYLNLLDPDADPSESDEDWQHGHTGEVNRRRLSANGEKGVGIEKPPMTKERYTAGFQGQSLRDRRQMPMFTVKSLEGHVHEDCPHWADQKHQMAHNIYTILFYVSVPFLLLLNCLCVDACLCISWMRQHHIYKKFIKQERKKGLNAVRGSMKLGGLSGIHKKTPAERML